MAVSRNGAAVRARPGAVSPRGQVSEMQRARLLGAAVAVVDELGWSRVTVAHICARARISRRTFYDLFANREDCLLAALADVVGLVEDELAVAHLDGLSWRGRVRTGLWTILSFFDREPVLARVCVVQSARGGQRVLEYREEILSRIASVIAQGSNEGSRARECPSLVAEGLAGASASILYTRLLKGQREPLSALLGELTGMIVQSYLGPAAASRERGRPAPVVLPRSPRREPAGTSPSFVVREDPLRGIPMRLTYRTARVLEDVAEHPGVSNRLVAEHAGIADQGQISKLLARLERLGLLANTGEGHTRGEPNAWRLTATGVEVTQSIRTHIRDPQRAKA